MAKRIRNLEDEYIGKQWREGDLIEMFTLNPIVTYQTPLMQEWLDVTMPELNRPDQYSFDKYWARAQKQAT